MKFLLLTVVSLCAFVTTMEAQDGIGFRIEAKEDTQISIQNIEKITYQDQAMLILMKNGETQRFDIAEIRQITFTNLASAIKSLMVGEEGEEPYTLYDLNGRIILESSTSVPVSTELKGLYMLRVGNRTSRIFLK